MWSKEKEEKEEQKNIFPHLVSTDVAYISLPFMLVCMQLCKADRNYFCIMGASGV